MSQKLFEAKKAVETQFSKDAKGKSAAIKWYYYYNGEVLESDGKPVHNTPGFKFQCSWERGSVKIVNID